MSIDAAKGAVTSGVSQNFKAQIQEKNVKKTETENQLKENSIHKAGTNDKDYNNTTNMNNKKLDTQLKAIREEIERVKAASGEPVKESFESFA